MHRAIVAVFCLSFLAATPTRAADLRLHVLDCGRMLGMEAEPFLPGVEERPERLDMVNRCFLIVHPKGTLLWDAGLPRGMSWSAMAWGYWAMTLGKTSIEMAPPLLEQLEALGMSAADIDFIGLSHSHFDHVGQAEDFASSTWLVQKVERDWLFDPELDNDSVQPSLLEALRDSKFVALEGDYDVFGDGRVQILSSPGHTPGHQCLFVDLEKTGPLVLSGDLYHSLLNRELRVAPSFNTDRAQTAESMKHIEALLEERGATLWIQHSPDSGMQAPAQLH